MKEVIITLENADKRLDVWLHENRPEESRSFWQKKIKNGELFVNHKAVKPHYLLQENDTIQFNLKETTSNLEGENIPLEILFEDDNYAVINKPPNLVVHPGSGNPTHTLVNALIHHFGKKGLSSTNKDRPGIVHRLDKDTSGVIIIAKNNTAHRHLSKQFEGKTIEKQYIALAAGHLHPQQGSINSPLTRSKTNRQKISVTSRQGSRHALTHYQVQKRFQEPISCDLLDVIIETGRTHQIRVHLEAIDHPILGDSVYGNPGLNEKLKKLGLKRQFLHAAKLSFTSPTTNKKVSYLSPLPVDLESVLTQLS